MWLFILAFSIDMASASEKEYEKDELVSADANSENAAEEVIDGMQQATSSDKKKKKKKRKVRNPWSAVKLQL